MTLAIALLALMLFVLPLVGTGRADSGNRLYLQVSSHDILPEAVFHARRYAGHFPETAVFESINGKLAVVVGTAPRQLAQARLAALKSENRVPQDTIATGGGRYAKMVWSAADDPVKPPSPMPRPKGGMVAFLTGSSVSRSEVPRAPLAQGRITPASLSARCAMISVLTAANGGFSTDPNREDSDFILFEQFCLARLFAITAAEQLVQLRWGEFDGPVAETCEAFSNAMTGVLADLGRQDTPAIADRTRKLAQTSAASRADLIGTGKICLGLGYKSDNYRTALAAAVLLHALGAESYGEYVGHHLLRGIGVAENPGLATAWLASGAHSAQRGDTDVFVNTAAERASLISTALVLLSGKDND